MEDSKQNTYTEKQVSLFQGFIKILLDPKIMNKQKDGKLKSWQIERLLQVGSETLRRAISLMRVYGIPICSDRGGYKMAKSPDDLLPTLQQLKNRRNRLNRVINSLNKIYLKWSADRESIKGTIDEVWSW